MQIDATLARSLLSEQFPQWAHLDVCPVEAQGWDNRSFRVGEEFVARLPSAAPYATQVEKEQRWLPRLASHLPVAVPVPIAEGRPGHGYPWKWSIYRWIEGETLSSASGAHATVIARDLGKFLGALHRVDAVDGPAPGAHNFGRGDDLGIYDEEVSRALVILEGRIDIRAAIALWRRALGTRWNGRPVWIHGDVSPGNLLVRSRHLAAVIDFGNLAVGDPACDLAIAWAWFDENARNEFRAALELDEGTWLRGRAWALWKALIVAAGLSRTNAVEYRNPLAAISNTCAPG